jgi:hypothetical protein
MFHWRKWRSKMGTAFPFVPVKSVVSSQWQEYKRIAYKWVSAWQVILMILKKDQRLRDRKCPVYYRKNSTFINYLLSSMLIKVADYI